MDLREKIKWGKPNQLLFFKWMYFFTWVCALSLWSIYFFSPLGNKLVLPFLLNHPEILNDTIEKTDRILLLMGMFYWYTIMHSMGLLPQRLIILKRMWRAYCVFIR